MLESAVFWVGMAVAVIGVVIMEGGRNNRTKLMGLAVTVLALVLFYISADK